MRASLVLLLLCPSIACHHDGAPGPEVDLSVPASDACGARDPNTGFYGCGYLVGACPTPGIACPCAERGTMVCQENHRWELILDVGDCPATLTSGPTGYQGLGCLGGAASCGSCSCDPVSETYQCPDGGA